MLAGIGQCRSSGNPDAQVTEFSLTRGQTTTDLPKAVDSAQLAEQHRDELGPAGKTPGVPLGFRVVDQLLELHARKKLENLTKDAAKSIHGLGLLSDSSLSHNNRTRLSSAAQS